ncbi:hypothetical protein OH76DRAFT_1459350 [Lentinus brumalis]|uniref:F-box domain-containing protein n=1 Tax=Lentinus brumalis TaxID=2498619 RepID=A0A371CKQ1_9APHY|nr:hypothetical protein OH76DRAFT_1459350 [Polyporus brumalis]
MTLLSGVYNLAQRFLGRGPRKDCLDRLPNEVILDIFSLLSVVEIIRLRRVSKLYRQLTQDAALWKKLLRRADIPLPMLPPTSQHTIDRMSGLEAERVLIRALSMARNWKSLNPKAHREWVFDTGEYRVLEMAVLAGGNHLVTSAAAPHDQYYSLIVWDMDVHGRPKMVAAVATESKAYDIQAKYMTINGEKSIVIAYIQREYHRRKDRVAAALGHIQQAGQLSTYHKLDTQFRYECVVQHLPLENLQRYVDIPYPYDTPQYRAEMDNLPKAFNYITKIITSKTLTCPVLGELFGAPYLVIAKGDNDIVFKKLEGEDRATALLTCLPVPDLVASPHTIKAIQLLPQEHSVFVVREVDTPRPMQSRRPTYLFEIYAALQCGAEQKKQQHNSQYLAVEANGVLGDLTHIYVPEFPSFLRPADLMGDDDKSSSAKEQTRRPRAHPPPSPDPPPPICIYAHRSNPEGIIRILFYARCFVTHRPPSPITPTNGGPSAGGIWEPTQVTYRHTLQAGKKLFQRVSDPDDVLRIIPSATRPLVCLAAWDDLSAAPSIGEVRPFIDRGWDEPPRVVDHFVQHPLPNAPIGSPCFAPTDPRKWDADADGGGGPGNLGKRVVAFAWDESIGRLVVAEDGVNALTVFDFAAAPRHEKDRGKRPQDQLVLLVEPEPEPDMDVLMMVPVDAAPAIAHAADAPVAGPSVVKKRLRSRAGQSSRRVARGASAAACR